MRQHLQVPKWEMRSVRRFVVRSRNPVSSSVISIYLHLAAWGHLATWGSAQLSLYEPVSIISTSDKKCLWIEEQSAHFTAIKAV